jgi:cobalt-zinc-cadmium efflux system membrane fusion protein
MRNHENELLQRAFGVALVCASLLLAPGCSEGGTGHDEDSHEREDAAHGGESVELTDAQIEAAGIRVERASPGEIARHLTMPAVVAADADAVTHVNPKAPGIVRSIHKRLGEAVAEDDLLCVIDSVELGGAASAFVRARALVQAAETTLQREGELFEARLQAAERVLEGAVEINRKIYEREKELQAQAVSTIRPLLEADRALQGAELEKERDLTDLRAERDARLLALEVHLTERRIDQDAASSALLSLGVDAATLADLKPGAPLLAGTYEIRAPRGGIVSGRHITTGEFVDAETKLYTLEDLSTVWIVASAFEAQIQSVRTGQAGRIRLDAFPGRVFAGEVTLVGYEVDPASRALGVRLELENPTLSDWPEEYPLRPGMFGSVDLVVARAQARVVLPESAIVHEGEGDYVFVRTARGTFERRRVELGPPSGDVVDVRAGVEPGDEVAVAGAFLLKSALRKGELGRGHGH